MTVPASPPVVIRCGGAAHGPHGSGPVLGIVRGNAAPTAADGYLCDSCAASHLAHCLATGITPPRIPPVTPATRTVPVPGGAPGVA